MKKTYQKPVTQHVIIQVHGYLQTSLKMNNEDKVEDSNEIMSRRQNQWDDDEL